MTSRKKILLIQPDQKMRTKASHLSRPIALAYVAALTPDHWEVEIVDEVNQPINFEYPWDLVGITAYTSNAPRAYEVADAFRKRGVPVILGGIHITVRPDEAMQYADSVVVGVAEPVWQTLLEDFENNRLKPRYDGKMDSLAGLPIPRRDLLPKPKGVEVIIASKGCPYNCEFCVTPRYYNRKFEHRPVREIIDELKTIKNKIVFFADDNLFGKNKYRDFSLELFGELKKSGLKKIWATYASLDFADDEELLKAARAAGCRVVYVGIESLNQKTLKQMKKGINYRMGREGIEDSIKKFHKHGIAVIGGIIVGNDLDEDNLFEEIYHFVEKSQVDIIDISILTPYPGTNLFDRMNREDRIEDNTYPRDWKKYNEMNLVIKMNQGKRDWLHNGINDLTRKLYSRRMILKSFFRTGKNTRSLIAAFACLDENINLRKIYLK